MRQTCMNMIHLLAKNDPRVVFIASDVSPGLLKEMKQEMPDRYFMEGVSEAHIVGMAAGLAMEGYVPFVVAIASFITRRCYEQIVLDLCFQNLPVRLIGIGGGLNYAPLGPTHQTMEDIAIMRALPNMTVVVPCDADEMKRLMPQTLKRPGPVYIRLAKGFDPIISRDEESFEIGKAIVMRKAKTKKNSVLLISTGVMTTRALAAAEQLASNGVECSVLHVHTVKPLDVDMICKQALQVQLVVTLEEHSTIGGLGSACLESLVDRLHPKKLPRIHRIGITDRFSSEYGTQDSLMEHFGLQPPQISKKVMDLID
ncbi:transketolase family protein [Candidatus Omnitrophota bacterium]